jgi:endonuclease/exonuclease/phosphatase family metal-dependent hydrolase
LGVWAFNSRAKKFGNSSSGYFLDAFEHYKEAISSSRRVIIAGDFNNGPQWDIPGHQNNFVDVNRSLNELGLFSTYHAYSKETFGLESMHTHFHQKNPEKKFHIDYIYTNFEEVISANIEKFENWSLFSDHTPLFTKLK